MNLLLPPSPYPPTQLAESWTEGEMFRPLELRGNDPSLAPFTTVVKNPTGTFEKVRSLGSACLR